MYIIPEFKQKTYYMYLLHEREIRNLKYFSKLCGTTTRTIYSFIKECKDICFYEMYYIFKIKPIYNKDSKYEEVLSVEIDDIKFSERVYM